MATSSTRLSVGYKQAKNSFLAVGQGHGPRGQHRKVYPLSMQVKEASSRGGWVGGWVGGIVDTFCMVPCPHCFLSTGECSPCILSTLLHTSSLCTLVEEHRELHGAVLEPSDGSHLFSAEQNGEGRGGGGRKGGREGDHGAAARLVQRVGRVVVCVCVCWQRPFKLLPGTRHSQLQKWPTPHGPTCHGGHAPGTAVVRP